MKRILILILSALLFSSALFAQEEPPPPPPPTGDCLITKEMVPCDLHVLLPGAGGGPATITLGPGVRRSDVRIIPAPWVQVRIVEQASWLDRLRPRAAYAMPALKAANQRFRNRVYSGATLNMATVALGAMLTNVTTSIPIREFLFKKITISDGTNTVVGWIKGVGTGSGSTGSELNTDSNAISDPNGSEANGTTGWTTAGAALTSQGAVKNVGSFAFLAEANTTPTADARVCKTIQTNFGLTAGQVYALTLDMRHVGSGGRWLVGLGINTYDTAKVSIATLTSADATFVSFSKYFTHVTDTTKLFVAKESSATNDGGIYKDNLSCKSVTAPSATGCTISSTAGGSTQSWTSNSGINANATSFTVTISAN